MILGAALGIGGFVPRLRAHLGTSAVSVIARLRIGLLCFDAAIVLVVSTRSASDVFALAGIRTLAADSGSESIR